MVDQIVQDLGFISVGFNTRAMRISHVVILDNPTGATAVVDTSVLRIDPGMTKTEAPNPDIACLVDTLNPAVAVGDFHRAVGGVAAQVDFSIAHKKIT